MMDNNEFSIQRDLSTKCNKCNKTFDWKIYEDMKTLNYFLVLICPVCKERHIYANSLAIMLENEFRRKETV